MNHAPSRRIQFLLVALLVTIALWWWVPAVAEAEEQPGENFRVTELSPEQYTAGEDLEVSVEGSPAGSAKEWLVETFLQPTPLTSEWQIENFLDGTGFPGWRLSVERVESRGSERVSWTVPQSQLPKPDTQTTGIRGLTVRLHSEDQTYEARSLLFYAPLEDLPETRLNLLVENAAEADWEKSLNVARTPGVTVALPALGDNRSFEGLDQAGVEIIALPPSGADISALASVSLPNLLSVAKNSRTPSPQDWNRAAILTNVVVSSEDGFTLAALQKLGGETVVAPDPWGNDERWSNSVTPTSRVQVDSTTGTITDAGSPDSVPVIDPWIPAQNLLNEAPGDAATELLLRQQLRNLGMMVGLEDPGDQRSLFVSIKNVNVEDERVEGRLDALLGNQWIAPMSFEELSSSEQSEVTRPPIVAYNSGLLRYERQLGTVESAYALAEAVDNSFTTPGPMHEYWSAALAPADSALPEDKRETLALEAVEELRPLSHALSVTPLSTVNVLHQDANFPVSVANEAERDARINVRLEPSDARLQAEQKVLLTVPANGQVEAQVPVRAVGSGDVTIRVELSNEAGQVLDRSEQVTVRVRPNWEDIGTITVGSLAALLFIFGLVRSVRKGKLRGKKHPAGEADRPGGQP